MAELASGAVTSLLGVIRNETRLLGRVRNDVQFIKEEMESMNSFLLHLARTAPSRGENDDQVHTWMNQVRLLAQDCNDCIHFYLGNPDIHLAKGGLWRYLLWAPWFLRKMVAQHRAAVQLAALKERARDVGERRLRYGVEVPAKAAGQSPPGAGLSAAAPAAAGSEAAEDDEDEDGDDQLVVTSATHHSGPRGALFGHRVVAVDYFNGKLADWIKDANTGRTGSIMPSIAIVAPDAKDARALADEALAVAETHFQRSVLVDIPAVHFFPLMQSVKHLWAPEPEDILCYIWRELELKLQLAKSESQQEGEGEKQHFHWRIKSRDGIQEERTEAIREIRRNIQKMKVDKKFEKIKSEIGQVKSGNLQLEKEEARDKISEQPLGALLLLLLQHTSTERYDDIIKETANKLKQRMEVEEAAGSNQPRPIRLDNTQNQYERILSEVFPKTSNSNPLQTQEQDRSAANEARKTTMTTTLGEDQIKEMIKETLQELQEDKSDKKQATGKPGGLAQNPEAVTEETMVEIEPFQILEPVIKETIEKIQKVQQKIKKLMEYKGIVDKIQNHLKQASILTILKTENNCVLGWEETRNALSLLGCVSGAVIVTTSNDTQQAKEYYPQREPLDCSLVGFYHDIVLELTGHQMHEDSYDPQIYRDILEKCKPHEFCMKIFAHALYANPKRTKEELLKLHSTLHVSPKSLGSIAKKIFKFSYNNLPKQYKACLLYLAIFPPGHKIRRSTLIVRWVVEGLITTDDWLWSSSVRKAEQCFDSLIDRWLVYPADIGATGKVKSCIVGHLVHKFIIKIAKKQRIVETRLSYHLAHHFSIFNNLHLRASDKIDKFFNKILPESSQLSQLKVLDLEGCHCFNKNRHGLKDICSKILLLKYLSLRRTDVTQLPREINNLRELQVLDIRQTKVPAPATRNVKLLKLKRLLAGHIDPAIGDEEFSSVCIPEKIEKMVDMEVLSNVKPQKSQDLEDIRHLWQLRKLGVVIADKNKHFNKLFRTISDLNECLLSLSITISTEGTPTRESLDDTLSAQLKHSPKLLESLSISGTTEKVALLTLLVKGCNKLNKVTLTHTRLNQDDLRVLAELPKLCCVRLQHITCTETNLTFKDKFKNLKYFLVEVPNLTGITFEIEVAPELEKIVLSSMDNLESLSGVENLPKLEELHLKNDSLKNNISKLLSFFDKAKQITKVTLRDTFLTQSDLQILAKKPNIRCLELLDNSYVESKLTFKKGEFPKLSLLIVDCSVITNISFVADGCTPMLKKIAWSFTNMDMESLSGIRNLPRLKELELIGDRVPDEVEEEIKKHEYIYDFKHEKPKNQD